MIRFCKIISITALFFVSGCGSFVERIAKAQEQGENRRGITYYVGGAGPIGNVGSWDIPRGLTDAGYEGFVEVFTWQGWTHAGDQMNLARNRSKGAELAAEIKAYRRRYPNQKINIIALSAGTGIATFALEYLPEGVEVDHVIYLGCSLSSSYDMTRALRRVNGGLYCIHSFRDPILNNVVWYTGTVDRSAGDEGIAGMEGFRLPRHKGADSERQYAKIRNVPYRTEFASVGYDGGHTDTTTREFVRDYLAPVILNNEKTLLGDSYRERFDSTPRPTTRPTTRPAPDRKEAVMKKLGPEEPIDPDSRRTAER
ncbi:MAG: hypothetical protein AABZ08_05480 [Planctomycetota bacterium]